jgi:hypothetical protein
MIKPFWTSVFIAAALSFGVSGLRAVNSDFEFHSVAKKTGEKEAKVHGARMGKDTSGQPALRPGITVLGKEEWAYEVTIENKTFHDVAGLEIKHAAFYEERKAASRAHLDGIFTLPALTIKERSRPSRFRL